MAEAATEKTQQDARQIKVTQVRSTIGGTRRQRETLKALGLRRIRHSVVRADNPSVRGMIAKVAHLVTVEEA
ncbi:MULTISPECIES: 50S ribosomal protein L30 [unclassified Actinomyces]|uniref:50S ribosomal protein L30 n=1 Tax=unclassified Actinomyces TaxID=2609248 RepID=UPI0013741118|nr:MULTISPECIES: 50S ribosomal protein L30 [unclassified Actinomyces]MBW3069042.1 50S ribosomal protein L30 [Actinomyces sp. 594]NDR54194.1 50S ribosomal protein L30 [Actinomyces sp. 565]QHO91627.1 50S ribosomal protein L30 [Actinomyces sp. 432]